MTMENGTPKHLVLRRNRDQKDRVSTHDENLINQLHDGDTEMTKNTAWCMVVRCISTTIISLNISFGLVP